MCRVFHCAGRKSPSAYVSKRRTTTTGMPRARTAMDGSPTSFPGRTARSSPGCSSFGGLEDVARIGTTGTLRRAVVALMAQPYVRIVEQAVLQSPLSPDHFLPRIGIVVGRYAACNRAGGTLVALLHIRAAGCDKVLGKQRSGSANPFAMRRTSLETFVRVGTGFFDRFHEIRYQFRS